MGLHWVLCIHAMVVQLGFFVSCLELQTVGVGEGVFDFLSVLEIFPSHWVAFSSLEGLHLVMSSVVDTAWRPALFSREPEKQWTWGEKGGGGGGIGRSGRRGNTSRIYCMRNE